MRELLVGTKKGLIVLRRGRRQGLRDRGPRVPGRGRGVRHARSPHRPLPRGRDARPVRPAPLLHRRPLREMGAGGRPGVSCERRRGRRAHLGDRARRRRRGAVVRRRPRRAVPQRRWRQELVAGARVVGRAGAAALESGRRRNVPQLDLPLARRCEAPGRQHLCRRRLADRRRRQELAAGRQGPGAALSARGGAPRHAHALRASHRARAAPALHPLHAVPRRRLSLRRRRRDAGPTSAPGAVCPPTSASRSPSTPRTPTAPSSSRCRRTWTA